MFTCMMPRPLLIANPSVGSGSPDDHNLRTGYRAGSHARYIYVWSHDNDHCWQSVYIAEVVVKMLS